MIATTSAREACAQEQFFVSYNLAEKVPSPKTPLPHQSEALKKFKHWFDLNHPTSGGILVFPTGSGKTFTSWRFLCNEAIPQGYKVLWLAHTHHLLEQAFYGLQSEVGQIAGGKKELRVRVVSGTTGHHKPAEIEPSDDVLICTLQSATRAYEKKHPRFFKFLESSQGKLFVVFDEAHHSPAPSYSKFIQALQKTYSEMHLLGLTATPTHSNEKQVGWLKELFQQGILHQAYVSELMASNILAEPTFETIQTQVKKELNESDLKQLIQSSRDLPEGIVTQLAEHAGRNKHIAIHYAKNKEKYGKTIIFADRWYQCEAIKTELINQGITADTIYTNSSEMKAVDESGSTHFIERNRVAIEKFKKNEFDVLINIRILTEGTDIPDVRTVFLTRQSTSKILVTQMVGRALRGEKVGGTIDAFVVSFIDEWDESIPFFYPEWVIDPPPIGLPIIDPPPPSPRQKISIALKAIRDLLRKLSIDVIPGEHLKYLPLGWYEIDIDDAQDDEIEHDSRLVMVFDYEAEAYQAFIKYLQEKKVYICDQFSQTELTQEEKSRNLNTWDKQFFAEVKTSREILLVNMFHIVRHVGQNDGKAPKWIEFSEREHHDLDAIAQHYINLDYGPRKVNEELREEFGKEERYWDILYTTFDFFKTHYDACVNRILNEATSPPPHTPVLPPDEWKVIRERVLNRDRHRCLCCLHKNSD
ncbi:MAG: DEAD/DEAH box helicase, partial [Leptolyngbyaceae bacterium]|nr:DEAD/DEAH box helicase [Leptolyngbyaceae bacterium]